MFGKHRTTMKSVTLLLTLLFLLCACQSGGENPGVGVEALAPAYRDIVSAWIAPGASIQDAQCTGFGNYLAIISAEGKSYDELEAHCVAAGERLGASKGEGKLPGFGMESSGAALGLWDLYFTVEGVESLPDHEVGIVFNVMAGKLCQVLSITVPAYSHAGENQPE